MTFDKKVASKKLNISNFYSLNYVLFYLTTYFTFLSFIDFPLYIQTYKNINTLIKLCKNIV